MAIILCIDTAGEMAIVGIGNETEVIAFETNSDQKNHAAFIQPSIKRVLVSASLGFNDIDAVTVVNGPGSYTGLRVGLASAKGICYALNKPLITLNTLMVMASAAVQRFDDRKAFYCPLIDARRNEVFTAVYDVELQLLLLPQPMILEQNSFNTFLDEQKMIFFGSGHNKCETTISHRNAVFEDVSYSIKQINELAQKAFQNGQFAEIAYTEPFYTKDFFSQV